MKNVADLTLYFILMITVATSCAKKAVIEEGVVNIPAHPLNSEQDLDSLLNRIGDAQIVLLGEASHGTSEYYTWRAAITKKLILEKGFTIIGVEGEWQIATGSMTSSKGRNKTALRR